MKILQLPIFKEITEDEFYEIQNIHYLREVFFEKHSTILPAGRITKEFGIVMEGSIYIENIDLWGNKSILSDVGTGQVFAETYALCQEPLMVDVIAASNANILFFNLHAAFSPQNQEKSWYKKLSHNLLIASTQKNLALSSRIFCNSSKTIRGRVLTYLSMQAAKNNSTDFMIPFNRQQMADYLNVDRSALSGELCRMRDDGIIIFHKNHFVLKQETAF